MRSLHNAKLAIKLSLLSGIAVLMMLILSVASVLTISSMNRNVETLMDRQVKPGQAISSLRASVNTIRVAYKSLAALGVQGDFPGTHNLATDQEKIVDAQLKYLKDIGYSGDQATAFNKEVDYWNQYRQAGDTLWKTYANGGPAEVSSGHYTDIDMSLAIMDQVSQDLMTMANTGISQGQADMAQRQKVELEALGVVVLLGLALMILMTVVIRRSILGPVRELTAVAVSMGNGDLRKDVAFTGRKDEIGQLHNAIAQMSGAMRTLLAEVSGSAASVDQASAAMLANSEEANRIAGQLAAAMQQVAGGASAQNENVHSTLQSMDEMRDAITQVAEGAREQAQSMASTSKLAAEAGDTVRAMAERVASLAAASTRAAASGEQGVSVVTQATTGMGRLREQVEQAATMMQALDSESRQIGQALTVIQEIAGQTNLLALNAAIEAARAGESGRGFAVVADEVRKLAERSAQSAGEISRLIRSVESRTEAVSTAIRESLAEVRESSTLASDAGSSLESIIEMMKSTAADVESIRQATQVVSHSTTAAIASVDDMAAIAEESAASTAEMENGSNQVGQSIHAIAEVAEQTAATAQEVSAGVEELSASTEYVTEAARTLAAVSQQLKQQVSRFQV